MVIKCEIKFDNNEHGIFLAGQMLEGTVVLTLDEPKVLHSLRLRIDGHAKCKWTERVGSSDVVYRDRDDYLNTILYLLRSSEGQKIELSAGTTKYNFSCQLPQDLPTSFEAKYGRIRYSVHVVLHRPWKFDLTYTVGFTVLKPYDLNLQASLLRNTTSIENVKVFSGGFRTSKPLYYTANIPFSGYVAGQVVDLSIYINNESRVNIEDIHIQLKKLVKYKCQLSKRVKRKEEFVTETSIRLGEGVDAQQTGRFLKQLTIPPVAPTNLLQCRVLTVSYEIRVILNPSGLHRKTFLSLPITIGTIPLSFEEESHEYRNLTRTSSVPSYSRANSELAPPSYEEAIGDTVDFCRDRDHTMGSKSYTPRYPVYSFQFSKP